MSVGRPRKIENEEKKKKIWYYKKKNLPYLDATSVSYMTKILRHAKEILLNKLQLESGGRVSIIENQKESMKGSRDTRVAKIMLVHPFLNPQHAYM